VIGSGGESRNDTETVEAILELGFIWTSETRSKMKAYKKQRETGGQLWHGPEFQREPMDFTNMSLQVDIFL